MTSLADVPDTVPAAARRPRTHGRRADAGRNHERIVSAAREAVVEFGPGIALDEIARRAGVGNATVYRHFSDRRALIQEVAVLSLRRIADLADRCLDESPDGFAALERFIHASVDERIGALSTLLGTDIDLYAPEIQNGRDRMDSALSELLERAKETGKLRADVDVGDLMTAICQLTRPLPGSPCEDFDGFVHRHLQIFVDGLRAPARSALPGRPAKFEDFHRSF